jgi:hypothetical protein
MISLLKVLLKGFDIFMGMLSNAPLNNNKMQHHI